MIIFLYGPDGYGIRKEVASIEEKYKKKHPNSVDLFNFDLSGSDAEQINEAIKTVSFFNDVKLITIKNCFAQKNNCDHICRLIEAYSLIDDKSIVLLFVETLPEKSLKAKDSRLFVLLSNKNNLIRDFEKLDGIKLEAWVKREFALRNCAISSASARHLIQSAGADTHRLIEEINKLSNYKLRGEIEVEDINNLVTKDIDLNIFNLLDAISSKNKVTALELLYKELETGRDPYYLLTMIVYQLRNMLIVNDMAQRNLNSQLIAQKTKLHPFVVRKIMSGNKYPLESIKIHFNYWAQADQLIKQGRADIEDCLYSFTLNC